MTEGRKHRSTKRVLWSTPDGTYGTHVTYVFMDRPDARSCGLLLAPRFRLLAPSTSHFSPLT